MPTRDDEYDDDRPRPARRPRRPADDDDYDDDRPRRRAGPATNGVATAALVLGILSLGCSFGTGLPAIICGVLGLSRAKQTGGRGHGMAVAGLVLGGVGSLLAVPVLIGLLLPAVQKGREAAARTKTVNNFKQISLGVQNHHDVYGRLPTADHRVNGGDPPPADPSTRLSWRYTVLPFIEQDNVFRQYHPTAGQAWDSPANRPMAALPVRPYMDPADGPADPATRLRVFVGPKTLFDPAAKPLTLREVADGLSQTALASESPDKGPWPQCKEIPFNPNGPPPALGRPGAPTFLVVFADGHVGALSRGIEEYNIKGMITASGGEVINLP